MTRPKKWFLSESSDSIILKNADGPIKKPNATQPMGRILSVSAAEAGKDDPEGIQFHCENGRIILALKRFEWNKSDISSKFALLSSADFVKKWDDEMRSHMPSQAEGRKRCRSEKSPTPSSSKQPQPRSLPLLSTPASPPDTCIVSGSPAKRCKYIKEDIDESIQLSKKGLMEIPVSQLSQPPRESRLLREADPTFVHNLKQKMISDPSAPGATPMAVLCKDVEAITEFNMKYKNVYKYEVLGGLHTLVAKGQLAEEYPDNPFFQTAMAEVYVGLSDEEALRLAQRHNLNSHFVHKVTHRDLMEACRARLYRMASQTMESETPKPTPAWRDSCKKAIIPEDVSNTHRDSIFSQASLPKKVWDLAVEVMDLFENAKLKGQKLNLSTLLTKPEFKQQYFAPIRRLDEVDQCSLLSRIIGGKITLGDLKTEAAEIKQMAALKTAFMRLTNTETWEQAEEKYPLFACESQLQKFIRIDLNKAVPQSFTDFCTRAKLSEGESDAAVSSGPFVQCGSSIGHVIDAKTTELSGQMIKRIYGSFRGANLALTSFREGSSRENIESTAYTIKELNAVAGCHLFTAAALCDPHSLSLVREVWTKAFVNTDILFAAAHNQENRRQGNTLQLTPCVTVIVLGFFSADDHVKKEHFNFAPNDPQLNFIEGNELETMQFLIEHFSQLGNTVLDITGLQGNAAVAALKAGRNVICVVEGEEICTSVFARLSQLSSD